ncbi:hypothetical protein BBO99_00009053 [Phytophthora kernoviae]|uniref:SCP domain-containing protein n=2 Tax=Phytophthora kernoviae TaxID=325452 RepID=A0A3R7HD33_9STRA|nr:hypothetical protein G195_010493 [Phytophthora kernoviae 00238/432]KAG2508042.1 hypothetical protein JM16_008823 [Phytophthora kernoviae]KAG2510618.1 hypothetical protein JM18_008863 [Phytophthora kernoviae]RLN06163.1 hypothetical protein BBI17_008977 [Phytophthora kernoviae]RLN74203.1 hypothetical protein BBO99_00009053 [Phytophthora kernoviae]
MTRFSTVTFVVAMTIAAISNVPIATGFQLGSSGRVMWEDNCDYADNNYRSVPGIPDVCGDVCADDSTCTHWAWNSYNGGTCWLKTGTPSTKKTTWGVNCGAQNGLSALTIDYRLMASAQLHSQDQANQCQMSHAGSNGSKMVDRIKAQNYNYNVAAENVAAGQTSVESVMTSWWNSPGHRANILNKDVVNVGFALANNNGCSNYATYWTQDFGREA